MWHLVSLAARSKGKPVQDSVVVAAAQAAKLCVTLGRFHCPPNLDSASPAHYRRDLRTSFGERRKPA
jgi:hypothetical protein